MSKQEMSYDTKAIITVILLVTIYPLGVVLMYRWMKWSKLLKFIIALPLWLLLLTFVGIVLTGILATVNPAAQIEKGRQQSIQSR